MPLARAHTAAASCGRKPSALAAPRVRCARFHRGQTWRTLAIGDIHKANDDAAFAGRAGLAHSGAALCRIQRLMHRGGGGDALHKFSLQRNIMLPFSWRLLARGGT